MVQEINLLTNTNPSARKEGFATSFLARSAPGWCWSRIVQRGSDALQDSFKILKHVPILKTENSNTDALKKSRPSIVGFLSERVVMHRTIEFHNDATFRTKKVRNIPTNTVLPAEFLAVERRGLEVSPEHGLCRRELASQFMPPLFEGWRIVNLFPLHAEQEA